MSSEIENYQTARAAYELASKRCQAISDTVREGASILSDWQRAMVSNATGGFPAEIALGRHTRSINATQWPTGQDVATALSTFHEAKSAMHNAYSSIPQEQRDVIVPPPK